MVYGGKNMGFMGVVIFLFVLVAIGVIVLAVLFGVGLLGFRNQAVTYQEKIKHAKSQVRLAQNKYFKQMQNTEAALGDKNGQSKDVGVAYGDMGSASKYSTNTSMITTLANAYESAQNSLNDIVSQYNNFITGFPNVVYARILKYERELYIDEDNLDKTMTLEGIDETKV